MKKSKFAFVTGLVLGTLTAFFLSPRSGKQNRELAQKKYNELEALLKEKGLDKKVTEIFGTVSEQSSKLYQDIHDEVLKNVSALNGTIAEVKQQDYFVAVEKALLKFKNVLKKKRAKTVTLRSYLKKEWDKLGKVK
ncbi:MAG: hypothetical protein NUV65_00315 [Candidatus Roizmanbacteria bacterium]|nr:hypothetical protein [Candidatus Roizmanbacteria bacterium]